MENYERLERLKRLEQLELAVLLIRLERSAAVERLELSETIERDIFTVACCLLPIAYLVHIPRELKKGIRKNSHRNVCAS